MGMKKNKKKVRLILNGFISRKKRYAQKKRLILTFALNEKGLVKCSNEKWKKNLTTALYLLVAYKKTLRAKFNYYFDSKTNTYFVLGAGSFLVSFFQIIENYELKEHQKRIPQFQTQINRVEKMTWETFHGPKYSNKLKSEVITEINRFDNSLFISLHPIWEVEEKQFYIEALDLEPEILPNPRVLTLERLRQLPLAGDIDLSKLLCGWTRKAKSASPAPHRRSHHSLVAIPIPIRTETSLPFELPISTETAVPLSRERSLALPSDRLSSDIGPVTSQNRNATGNPFNPGQGRFAEPIIRSTSQESVTSQNSKKSPKGFRLIKSLKKLNWGLKKKKSAHVKNGVLNSPASPIGESSHRASAPGLMGSSPTSPRSLPRVAARRSEGSRSPFGMMRSSPSSLVASQQSALLNERPRLCDVSGGLLSGERVRSRGSSRLGQKVNTSRNVRTSLDLSLSETSRSFMSALTSVVSSVDLSNPFSTLKALHGNYALLKTTIKMMKELYVLVSQNQQGPVFSFNPTMVQFQLTKGLPFSIQNVKLTLKFNGTTLSPKTPGHAAIFENLSLVNEENEGVKTQDIFRMVVFELATDYDQTETAEIETFTPRFFDEGSSWSFSVTELDGTIDSNTYKTVYKPKEKFCWVKKVHYKKISDLAPPLKSNVLKSFFKDRIYSENVLSGFVKITTDSFFSGDLVDLYYNCEVFHVLETLKKLKEDTKSFLANEEVIRGLSVTGQDAESSNDFKSQLKILEDQVNILRNHATAAGIEKQPLFEEISAEEVFRWLEGHPSEDQNGIEELSFAKILEKQISDVVSYSEMLKKFRRNDKFFLLLRFLNSKGYFQDF